MARSSGSRDDALHEYDAKRDFGKTPEPGPRRRRAKGRSFVVQKHDASHLHYDFRLEHEGTLLSWAVPKGPSLDPSESRLAVRVEDHPVAYGDFEGVIPAGQYGAGTVLLWDRGTWEPIEDPGRGLERGKLAFRLHGEKLRGEWRLIRTRAVGTGAKKKVHWLLKKIRDGEARTADDPDILEERPESVLSGQGLDAVAGRPERVWQSREAPRVDAEGIRGARRGELPAKPRAMLATAVDAPPTDDGWLHELKLDGYRILARVEEGRARLLTRGGKDWTARLPRLASALAYLPVEAALVDTEVVALEPGGRSDFQALQRALGRAARGAGDDARLWAYAFDLLHLDGWDLTGAPLVERKRLLRELLEHLPPEATGVRFSEHVTGDAEELFREACRQGAEGLVAKRADSTYRAGRHRDWLKVKCRGRQELVVVGFTDPSGARKGFGALLLGVHDDAEDSERALRYAGRVGTGFDDATLAELHRRLVALERDDSPLADAKRARGRGVHWVEPRLVAEVAFGEWTGDGVLRHASFMGLREDKDPVDVVRERSEPPPRPAKAGKATTGKPKPGKAKAGKAKTGKTAGVRVAGVALSNPDRVLFPEQALTKRDLASYYEAVGDVMLPHVARRPLSLLRCPQGRDGECFFQKHLGTIPDALQAVPLMEKDGTEAVYVALDSLAGLVELAQLGVLEIHPWGSRTDDLERPDRLVFDLDPDESIIWRDVVTAARHLRDVLAGLGLESLPLLTGGKGVHVVVPIAPDLDWDRAKAFTRGIAELLVSEEPERFTAQAAKAKRRGKIFIDYLRNGRGATAIAPYSPRARPGAPVATPIRWDELRAGKSPQRYDLRSLPRRLRALGADPWGDWQALRQTLPAEVVASLTRG